MTKLSDTQRVILSAASQRTDRIALPLPKSLKGGAAHKVVNALIEKGLLREVKANRKLNDPVWRDSDEGHGITLIVTDAGLQTIGVETDSVPKRTSRRRKVARGTSLKKNAANAFAPAADPRERKIREGTKQALVIEMLSRPQGATIAEIVEATNWASHTIRGFLTGALKRELRLEIASEKHEPRGRVYRLG